MVFIIGHRGACGYEPENTLRSFRKALELKVDMVELDVHKCKSGELVVIHDDRLERTTNGNGYVGQKILKELKSLDAGKGETIPTLQEVFDFVDRKAKIAIEIKDGKAVKPLAKLIKEYTKRGWNYNDFIAISFNHYWLKELKRIQPKIRVGALLMGIPIEYSGFAKKINADAVLLASHWVNREYVEDAHRRNLKVIVWTVNEEDEIARMKKLGVDGIASNYPDKVK
ncbi:MAG TPA: glycerophosphodiester phosphodiesterase family protein [Candidatus Nanoarchaeia archaeon]|nr:glycerophosphodiester phosphodiesterase family protein [Candidatus Nanoarchaeia archaeon]